MRADMVRRLQGDRTTQTLGGQNVAGPGTANEVTKKTKAGAADQVVETNQGAPLTGVPGTTTKTVGSRALDPTTAALEGARVGTHPRIGAFLTTASGVEQVLEGGALSSLSPSVPTALLPYARQIAAALKRDGVIGSHGALGNRGPLGNHAWNPSFWMKMIGDWTKLSAELTKMGGPGSGAGSLGSNGPLSKTAYEAVLPNLGPLASQLQAGGLFAVLGPLGPLGALGALGFLGQVGGHGFRQDDNGQFQSADGKVVRNTDVEYEGGKRSYELTEFYPEDFAADMKDNDASWMIRGDMPPSDPEDTFTFRPKPGQIVTLTVVPESEKDIFTVELLDNKGEVIATSDSDDYVNWIQFQAKDAEPLKVRVQRKDGQDDRPNPINAYIDALLSPMRIGGEMMKPWLRAAGHKVDDVKPNAYRLFSVGSPKALSDQMIRGAHQVIQND